MKKFATIVLASAMVLSLAACGKTEEVVEEATEAVEEAAEETAEAVVEEATEAVEEAAEEATEEATEEETDSAVMTYEEYAAAELDTEVTVETYVQATQSWWDNTITVYSQDENGGYFMYSMACSEEDAAKLVPGTKIRVNGFKSEWSGEVEIVDATFEIIDGNYVAEAVDLTDKLGTDELADFQNQFVSFSGLTVEAANDEGAAFLYNWDGSGEQGSDLYFNVTDGTNTYTFTVESYLCGADTDVYKAVEALNVGDVIDVEGFLYWYEGAQPHVTSVTVK